MSKKQSDNIQEKVNKALAPGAKTHKGRLHLKKFEPMLNEGPRSTLLAKGSKSSEMISKLFLTMVIFLFC